MLPLQVPQILIIGKFDVNWAPGGEAYFRAATAANDDVVRQIATDSGHFEMIVPSSTTWPMVKDAAWSLLRR